MFLQLCVVDRCWRRLAQTNNRAGSSSIYVAKKSKDKRKRSEIKSQESRFEI
jgi:hypothetical protein